MFRPSQTSGDQPAGICGSDGTLITVRLGGSQPDHFLPVSVNSSCLENLSTKYLYEEPLLRLLIHLSLNHFFCLFSCFHDLQFI